MKRHTRQSGFTLAEVLIAIAILGIGLSMVAMLFPAAMAEDVRSTEDVLASVICRNALAAVRGSIAHDDPGNPFAAATLGKAPLTPDLYYPADGAGDSGALAAGRQMASGNDYQLVLVAFRKSVGGAVGLADKAAQIVDFEDRSRAVIAGAAGQVQVGSPVICRTSGRWARIVAAEVDGATDTVTAMLDRWLPPAAGEPVYVLYEQGASRSPALGLLVTRTALRE